MIQIPHKTLQDIEFPKVLQQVSEHCVTALGTERLLKVLPFDSKEDAIQALSFTNEYLSSFHNDNRIPSHGFEPITKEIKYLKIENSFLETLSFKKIASISTTVNDIVLFLKKFEDYYPTLYRFSSNIEVTKMLIERIDANIDRFADVKDKASDELFRLRQEINTIKGKINQSFASALTSYSALDYLDDIRESVMDNKRVLAVKAMYRRKVKGTILGGSKTGSIVYIEPEATFRHTRELNNLEFEEEEEVTRILKSLTDFVRPFVPLLQQYQQFLTEMDVIFAKATYANNINGVLPNINSERIYNLKDA